MLEYKNQDCNRFIKDMIKAGHEPYHYRGRFFWAGPAVNVSNLQDALSNTKIRCQWDNMGFDYVVYPVAHAGKRLDKDEK